MCNVRGDNKKVMILRFVVLSLQLYALFSDVMKAINYKCPKLCYRKGFFKENLTHFSLDRDVFEGD